MNVEQFISESLVQIARGSERANTELAGSSAKVNPKGIATGGADTDRVNGYLAED